MNLTKNVKIQRASAAVAAGTTLITSDAVDTKGFDGCTFLALFGAIVTGALTSLKVQGSHDNSTYVDLEGSAYTVADDQDSKIAYAEVARPQYRYLKCLVSRGTQNATLDGIVALLTGPAAAPVTHDAATVMGGEVHASPAEGTA